MTAFFALFYCNIPKFKWNTSQNRFKIRECQEYSKNPNRICMVIFVFIVGFTGVCDKMPTLFPNCWHYWTSPKVHAKVFQHITLAALYWYRFSIHLGVHKSVTRSLATPQRALQFRQSETQCHRTKRVMDNSKHGKIY